MLFQGTSKRVIQRLAESPVTSKTYVKSSSEDNEVQVEFRLCQAGPCDSLPRSLKDPDLTVEPGVSGVFLETVKFNCSNEAANRC